MSSIDDIVAFIRSRRDGYKRQLASDLARLRLEYGNRIVDQALALADEAERRSTIATTRLKPHTSKG
jgi:hypothetical protein